MLRTTATILTIGAFGVLLASAPPLHAQLCGDADGDGAVTDTDGVQTLRAAAGLSSRCTLAVCDIDADGEITDTDGVGVLRKAAALPVAGNCTALPTLELTRVASDLDKPLFVAGTAGDPSRLYIVEQSGRIRLLKNGVLVETPFLDVSDLVSCCGERGLLGLAFHPAYAANGRFFVDYTDRNGDTVIAEYGRSAVNPDVADPSATRVFFGVQQPFANHNGGMVAFGPDGLLYVGLGDGGNGGDPLNNGQSLATKLGKILRIDVDAYPLPPPGNLAGGDPDIWDFGLRNPFRFSFDRVTGDLYIGDVGQGRFEEVDVEPAGLGRRNYGWRITEGFACFDPMIDCSTSGITPPVVAYDHGAGDCAVIGGYVYRGQAIPGLTGRYLYGDFCSNHVRSFVFSGGVATAEVDLTADLDSAALLSGITSFGEDGTGELYIVDSSGSVFRIDAQ